MGYDGALSTRTKDEFDRYCSVCRDSMKAAMPSMEYRSDGDYAVIDFGSIFRGLFDAIKYDANVMTKVENDGSDHDDDGCYGYDIPQYDLSTKAFDGLCDLRYTLESTPLIDDFITVLKQEGVDVSDDVDTYWSAIMTATSEQRDGWNDELPTSCVITDPIEAMRRRASLYRIIDGSGLMPEIACLIKEHIVIDGPKVIYAIETFADVGFVCKRAEIRTLRLTESW